MTPALSVLLALAAERGSATSVAAVPLPACQATYPVSPGEHEVENPVPLALSVLLRQSDQFFPKTGIFAQKMRSDHLFPGEAVTYCLSHRARRPRKASDTLSPAYQISTDRLPYYVREAVKVAHRTGQKLLFKIHGFHSHLFSLSRE